MASNSGSSTPNPHRAVTHPKAAPKCPHGVVGGDVQGIPVRLRCGQCYAAHERTAEREAILTYGSGWIDGYTGDDLPEVAKALDLFLTDVRELQHHVD